MVEFKILHDKGYEVLILDSLSHESKLTPPNFAQLKGREVSKKGERTPLNWWQWEHVRINQWPWAFGVPWTPGGFVLGLPPTYGFWNLSIWVWNMTHLMPCRNPCELYAHLAFTYSLPWSLKCSVKRIWTGSACNGHGLLVPCVKWPTLVPIRLHEWYQGYRSVCSYTLNFVISTSIVSLTL